MNKFFMNVLTIKQPWASLIIVLLIVLISMLYLNKEKGSNNVISSEKETIDTRAATGNNYEIIVESYSEKGKLLFSEFLEKHSDIVSYKINNCEMKYYYDNEFICFVDYDIQTNGVAQQSKCAARNGILEGNWIVSKTQEVILEKQNGEFMIKESGTGGHLVDLEENN